MNKLREEIEKHYKLTDSELIEQSSSKLNSIVDEEQKKKVNGIKSYYEANKKLTEGQKESLVRFLATINTFN